MLNEDTKNIIAEFTEEKKIILQPIEIDDFIAYQTLPHNLEEILIFLKTSPSLRFTTLIDIFGADFPEQEQRFEINYILLSLKLNMRILLRINCSEESSPPSIHKIFPGSCWYEREIFDMYGVTFSNSLDMRRILTDYGFIGHPLRKDFPLTGYVQVKYDEVLEKVIYEPVKLDQEYRNFDFTSPWKGPEYVLPGDEKAKNN